VLYRRLQQLGIDCIVVAPSKTPQAKGGRQKTNRRDACNWPGCTVRAN